MYDLTIIKHNGGAYVDSRDVAVAIGKRHDNLLRDIDGYLKILRKSNALNFEGINFFVESTYIDTRGREKPCYLISKLGCEVCAHKLTGEKGVLFTAAYVKRFNEMEAAEREAEIKSHAKPRLGEFNSAVKNVLSGMSLAYTAPDKVMKFLRGAYEPLGIEVLPYFEDDYYGYYTATEIAGMLGIYSYTGRPHALAVSAIISKLDNWAHHAMVVPYGLVGVNYRYDNHILESVRAWIEDNNRPALVPYHDFDYHIFYTRQMSLDEFDEEGFFKYE
jgi:Rha family phage regulatory protein